MDLQRPVSDFQDELRRLVDVLPEPLHARVMEHPLESLLEVVLDLGRPPNARLTDRTVSLGDHPLTREELDQVVARIGEFGADNRAGIERTLHRISAIRNRHGTVVGLTLRVGRTVYGTIDMIRDLVETGLNLLLLGRPGIGKTTKLREVARVLADDVGKRVIVIDTSNEIGGDGDIPHPAIGAARRMQVSRPDLQHAVMIEAVENHMPEAIVIDEIGTSEEAAAARTIAERGVQLIATAHGNTLENLILNPTLSDLVGGMHTVTLSDEEARRRGTQKTIAERRAPPTFDIVVELVERDDVLVHRDTAQAVDRLLAGQPTLGERRHREATGQVSVQPVREPSIPLPPPAELPRGEGGPLRLHAHGVARDLVERVLRNLGVQARVVDQPDRADVILALRSRSADPRIRRAVEGRDRQLFTVRRASSAELTRVLRNALRFLGETKEDQVREAILETEHAIRRVMSERTPVPLAPRPPGLRKLQHRLISRYHLDAQSVGREPFRHLVVYPGEAATSELPAG